MKRSNKLNTLIKVGATLLLGTVAAATAATAGSVPVLDPQCNGAPKGLKGPSRGTGVFFDASCETAYVLPPAFGKAELVAMTRSSNLTFCPAVNNAGTTSSNTVESAKIISQQIKDMLASYDPLNKELIALRQQTSDALAIKDAKVALATEAKKRADNAELAMKTTTEAWKTCRVLATNPDADCAQEAAAKDEAKTSFRDAYGKYSIANETAQSATLDYDTAEGRLIEQQTRYTDAIKPLTDLEGSLIRLSSSVLTLYREYARLEGTTGQILYTTQWQDLVNEYKRLNPALNLTFRQMPITDGDLTVSSRTPTGSDDLTVPALLAAAIPGVKPMGATHFPTGERLAATGSGAAEGPGEMGAPFIGFSNGVSGQIVLSLNGACPYFDSPTGAPSNIDAQNLTAHLVVNMQYAFDVQAKRSYTSHYNLSSMTSIFERHVEEGGLFDTSVINEKFVNSSSSDWFGIDFNETGAGFGYTDEQKRQITAEEKIDLMSRGIRQMAVLANLGGAPLPMPGVKQSGVGAAGEALESSCGFNIFCVGGGAIFGVLDSIFGDKEAVSNFKMNNNVWVSNQVKDTKMLRYWNALTFRPDAGF